MVTNVKAGLVLSSILGAGIYGCAGRGPEPPPGTYSTVLQRVDGPFVLGGIEFEAEMEQPIGSDISRPGDVFAARVTTPLRAPWGEEVVPAGARVTGRVVESLNGRIPALAVRFESIETKQGAAPVHAALESAGGHAAVAMAPPPPPSDTGHVTRWEFDSLLRPSAIGGGPVPEGAPRAPTVPVRIPSSAVVRMVLLESVVPPGVAMERPPRELVWPYGRSWVPKVYNYQ